jgi:hypothetical protein
MKRILAVVSLASLVACSTPPQTVTVAMAEPASDVSCEMTYVTGSALPKKRCETPEEKARQRQLAKETGDTLSRSVIVQKRPGEAN